MKLTDGCNYLHYIIKNEDDPDKTMPEKLVVSHISQNPYYNKKRDVSLIYANLKNPADFAGVIAIAIDDRALTIKTIDIMWKSILMPPIKPIIDPEDQTKKINPTVDLECSEAINDVESVIKYDGEGNVMLGGVSGPHSLLTDEQKAEHKNNNRIDYVKYSVTIIIIDDVSGTLKLTIEPNSATAIANNERLGPVEKQEIELEYDTTTSDESDPPDNTGSTPPTNSGGMGGGGASGGGADDIDEDDEYIEILSMDIDDNIQNSTSSITVEFSHNVDSSTISIADFVSNNKDVFITHVLASDDSNVVDVNICIEPQASGDFNISVNEFSISSSEPNILRGPSSVFVSDDASYSTVVQYIEIESFEISGNDDSTNRIGMLTFSHNVDASSISLLSFVSTDDNVSITGIGTSIDSNMVLLNISVQEHTHGSFQISISENSVASTETGINDGPNQLYTSQNITYDRRVDTIEIESFVFDNDTDSTDRTATITFSHDVETSSIATSDFESNDDNISITSIEVSDDPNIVTLDMTVANNKSGSFSISLLSDSISSSETDISDGPIQTYTSETTEYNTYGNIEIQSCTFDNDINATERKATIRFTHNVKASTLSIADFTSDNNNVVVTDVEGNDNSRYVVVTLTVTPEITGTFTLTIDANSIDSSVDNVMVGPTVSYRSGEESYHTFKYIEILWWNFTNPSGNISDLNNWSNIGLTYEPRRDSLQINDITSHNSNVTVTSISYYSINDHRIVFEYSVAQNAKGVAGFSVIDRAFNPVDADVLPGPTKNHSTYGTYFDTYTYIEISSFEWKIETTTQVSATIKFSDPIDTSTISWDNFIFTNTDVSFNSSLGITPNEIIIVSIIPDNVSGTQSIRIPSKSISSSETGIADSPRLNYTSPELEFDTRTYLEISSWHLDSPDIDNVTSETRNVTIKFTYDLDNTEPTLPNFSVDDTNITLTNSVINGDTVVLTYDVATFVSDDFKISVVAGSFSTSEEDILNGPKETVLSNSIEYDTQTYIDVLSWDFSNNYNVTNPVRYASLELSHLLESSSIDLSDFQTSTSDITIVEATPDTVNNKINLKFNVSDNSQGSANITLKSETIASTENNVFDGPRVDNVGISLIYDTQTYIEVESFSLEGEVDNGIRVLSVFFTHALDETTVGANDFQTNNNDADLISILTDLNEARVSFNIDPASFGYFHITVPKLGVGSSETYIVNGPRENYVSEDFYYDTRAYIEALNWSVSRFENHLTVRQGFLYLSHNVDTTSVNISDFQTNDTNVNITDILSINDSEIEFEITTDANTYGDFIITINENVFSSSQEHIFDGPTQVSNSGSISYDTRPHIQTNSVVFDTNTTSSTRTATLTMSHNVLASSVETSDFSFDQSELSISSISASDDSNIITLSISVDNNSSGVSTLSITENSISSSETDVLDGPDSVYTSDSIQYNTI